MKDVCAIPLSKGAHEGPDEGMCVMHAQPTDADLERFRANIRHEANGCMIWTGTRTPNGYGMFYYQGRSVRAARFSYMLSGEIPVGFHLDHFFCGVRACVNPAHVEPVTPAENIRRSAIAPATINAAKTHCPKGHSYSGDNLHIRPSGIRECRECGRLEGQNYRTRNRDKINAAKRAARKARRLHA